MEMNKIGFITKIDCKLLLVINKIRLEKVRIKNLFLTTKDIIIVDDMDYALFSLLPGIIGGQLLVEYKNVVKFNENMKLINKFYYLFGDYCIELPYKLGKEELQNIKKYNRLLKKTKPSSNQNILFFDYCSAIPLDIINLINEYIQSFIKNNDNLIYYEYYKKCLEIEDKRNEILLSSEVKSR